MARNEMPQEPPRRAMLAQGGVSWLCGLSDHWRRGRPTLSLHPFPRALERRGMTVQDWARKHRVSRQRARSWYDVNHPRRIPRRWAVRIQRDLGVPLAAWTNGVRG